MKSWLVPETRKRRLLIALGIYAVCTPIYFAVTPLDRMTRHTNANHHVLLADSWLRGRLDLGHPPPQYTGNNDFAQYQQRWYVSFPPFPAVVALPVAAVAGTPEKVRDGQIWLWLGALGPAVMFLALEKLRRSGHSERSERTNIALAAVLAFGTVYFFTVAQGTVWFAAHVVAMALMALYLLFAIDAERPVLAGLMIVLAFATRGPSIALGAAFFALEAIRVSARPGWSGLRGLWQHLDGKALARRWALFAAAILPVLALILWHNHARFGSVFEFGHNLLVIGWRGRIDKWGLISYHFLPRNLGVALTSLPWILKVPGPFQISMHGLALWVTTPIYLWLLWPRRSPWLWRSLAVTAGLIALIDLCYQNTGWEQFGYRFSNDYAVLLVAMLAAAGFRMGRRFWALAAVGVAINAFGAFTFHRAGYGHFYHFEPSQQVIYQPD